MRSRCTSRGRERRSGRLPLIWESTRRRCGTGYGQPGQAGPGAADEWSPDVAAWVTEVLVDAMRASGGTEPVQVTVSCSSRR